MSSSLQVRWTDKGFSVTGTMDDRTTEADLLELVPIARLGKGPIEINVEGLSRGNSIGMLEWEKFTQHFAFPFYYRNAQFWLVNYFNLIANFFENPNGIVYSFYAPFVCEADDTSRNVLMVIGKDVPLRDRYDDFIVQDLNLNGKIYSPDFVSKRYFSFLVRNRQRFEKFLAEHTIK